SPRATRSPSARHPDRRSTMLSLRDLKKLDRDDLLDLVGLQRASSTDWVAPALTALGVGLLVGVGVGLLLAPKPGGGDCVDLVGLQRASSTDWVAPALTALGVGLLVGVGVGLLLAPKPG